MGNEENIKRILDGIANVAPHAWQQAVEYTRLDAAVALAYSVTLVILCSLVMRAGKNAKDEFLQVGGVVLGGGGIFIFFNAIPKIISPEGALIRSLIQKAAQ